MSDIAPFASDTPLRAVSADDLKRVWQFIRSARGGTEAAAQAETSVGFDIRLIEQQCKAGADAVAVFFRAALLQMLFDGGLLDEWRDGNEIGDSVFRLAAAYPLEAGVQGFDAEAFIERLR